MTTRVYPVFVRFFTADGDEVTFPTDIAATPEIAAALVRRVKSIRDRLVEANSRQLDDVEDEDALTWEQYETIVDAYQDMFLGYAYDIAYNGYFETWFDGYTLITEMPQ